MVRQGVIPPYLLERIAGAAPREASREARLTLVADQRLRVARTLEADDGARPGGRGGLHREISDAGGSEDLPGRLVRKEGQDTVDDVDVNRAYDGLGATYGFLDDAFGRSSLDGDGLALEGTVHFGSAYDNAFWDGSRMVFGDGDRKVFNSFTSSLSVIAHELGHGLLQYTTNLAYEGQSGALNESFADVVGVMVEQHALGQTVHEATWLIGEGIFAPGIQGAGIRSLAAPGTAYDDPILGKDPQPSRMDGFVRTREDNGGVHMNSGIPNHAFYLAATELGGHAWERVGRVWFETVAGGKLDDRVDFVGFARETVVTARRLFGLHSDEEAAIGTAWRTVGVGAQ
ncbi:M4 family metallopeptidase [Sinomonas gamaensis]|jgi:Zn-dependent metalloprotease|uniref:M4 family metallopeptidase n=1 Tax=Sinomonas gamaensis TaxID=2565624 RepID=UPI001107EF93|nr:M4 family metallopeptidase [Sinomonas gamaensis]